MAKSKGLKPFAVVDAETDPFEYGKEPAPFIWGFYDGCNYFEFFTTKALVDYLRGYDGIVYAHNGGRFDWHFLVDYFEPGEKLMLINGRIASVKLGDCELRDSWNILPIPLAAYQKDEIDYNIFKKGVRDKHENMTKIRDYLRGDCRYTYELVSAFVERHGQPLTQAGASMKAYQKMTGKEVPKSSADYYDDFKKYYYGGRVQCFERGVKDCDFEVFDINSAYPYAMLSQHPDELFCMRAVPDDLEAWAFEHPSGVVALDCVSKGALPWRKDVGEKIQYPDDNQVRRYYVTAHELVVAFRHKKLSKIKVRRCWYWPSTDDFRSYILPLYQERQEAKARGDDAANILAKLGMNSLYGKFAADSRKYKAYKIFEEDDMAALVLGECEAENEKRKYTMAGHLGPWLVGQADLYEAEQRFYNVATALSITGYVRAMLFDAICKSERVLYCDTDSLAIQGAHDLDLGGELGQWESEGLFDRYAIAGRKLYAFRYAEDTPDGKHKKGSWKVRSKGVRLAAYELEKIAKGGEVNYKFDAPTYSVKRGITFTDRTIRAEI